MTKQDESSARAPKATETTIPRLLEQAGAVLDTAKDRRKSGIASPIKRL